MAYLIMGLIALLVILPISRLLRKDPGEIGALPDGAKSEINPPEKKDKKEGSLLTGLKLSQALRTSNYWIFSAAWLVTGFCTFLVLTHIVPYATDANITTIQAATIMSLMGGIAIPSGILIGRISDNVGKIIPLITIFLLRAIALVGAASHNWWKFDLAISYNHLPSQSILLSNECFL